jgi:hypothetical protein
MIALWLSLAAGGCAAGMQEPTCVVDGDCASGVCRPDGRCAPAASGDAAAPADAGPGPDADPPTDAGAADARDGLDGAVAPLDAGLCAPDRDGRIVRAEVPLAAGLRATFQVATDATVSTAGETRADGSRRWDFSGALPGDHATLVETLPLEGRWFAGSFPGATYAAELADASDLLGVFELTPAALLLRGVASPDDGPTRTLLTHDPPVTVLSFPVAEGGAWTTTSLVTGQNLGLLATWTERYDSTVDAHGELAAPFGTFGVLRVRTTLTRTVGVVPTVTRTHLFAAECFGTVAAIRSRDNETRDEFTTAAEIRRLAP